MLVDIGIDGFRVHHEEFYAAFQKRFATAEYEKEFHTVNSVIFLTNCVFSNICNMHKLPQGRNNLTIDMH